MCQSPAAAQRLTFTMLVLPLTYISYSWRLVSYKMLASLLTDVPLLRITPPCASRLSSTQNTNSADAELKSLEPQMLPKQREPCAPASSMLLLLR